MLVFTKELQQIFQEHTNPQLAASAEAYMKNQFRYFGIYTQQRRKLSNDFIKAVGIMTEKELYKTVKDLWQMPYREFQYVAIELISFHKKYWTEDIILLTEFCLIRKSWWDSVDHIASDITGPYFKLYPYQTKAITGTWNKNDNFWLQRSSIMFQKSYRQNTDTDLLKKYILNCCTSKEFFVQKAIGWALREYSKTNPQWVEDFVTSNTLPALSKREALKRIMK